MAQPILLLACKAYTPATLDLPRVVLKSLALITDTSVVACGFARSGQNDDFLLTKTFFDRPDPLSAKGEELVQLSLYPNPAKGVLNLEMALPAGTFTSIKIFDMAGTLLVQNQFEYSGRAHGILLPAIVKRGMYLIRVEAEGKQFTTKFVAQ